MSETPLPTTVEWTTSPSVCAAIMEAVAEAKAVDPLDLDAQLYDVVDPDAVERLFGPETGDDHQLSFAFEGCAVVVRGDGLVSVSSHEGVSAGSPSQVLSSEGV